MIYNVIDQIITAIPKEECDNYPNMLEVLRKIQRDTEYRAPEQMPEYFRQVSYVLETYLGEPDTDWKREIVEIFADRK